MAERNLGISRKLLIHPGETISDLLESRGMSQKELAQRAGVSEAFLCEVIHGRKDISKGLAMGLQYALGIPASFWLNLQANYDAELLETQEAESVRKEEIAAVDDINEIVDHLRKRQIVQTGLSLKQEIVGLRKYLRVSDLSRLSGLASIMGKDVLQHVNPTMIGAWVCLCKGMECSAEVSHGFEPEATDEMVSEMKDVMTQQKKDCLKTIGETLARFGISFGTLPAFRGAPVRAFISHESDDSFRLVLSLCDPSVDAFWFSLFHEFGHIVNRDVPKGAYYVDFRTNRYLPSVKNGPRKTRDDDRERAADRFAKTALMDTEIYSRFVTKGVFSYKQIQEYSRKHEVPSFVLLGLLHGDGYVTDDCYSKHIPKYEWKD